MKDECYVPESNKIALQSEDNKQGRKNEAVSSEVAQKVQSILTNNSQETFNAYNELLDMGIAREISRINLPLSMYTEFYWQIDLHNLFHFLKLRLDAHAQYEIRAYAEVMLEMVEKVCPIATEAFKNLKLGSVTFSERELKAIKDMLEGKEVELEKREKELFEAKLK